MPLAATISPLFPVMDVPVRPRDVYVAGRGRRAGAGEHVLDQEGPVSWLTWLWSRVLHAASVMLQGAGDPDAPVVLEIEMARRAGAGDARAQAWLARRLMHRVRQITRALIGNTACADDAAQLSLMAILRSAGGYRGDASLEAWAKRISVRTTLRYIQRERRRSADVSLHEVGEPGAGDVAPQQTAALSRDVRVFLESVSEVQRTALVLHHALGYSLDEIAEMTGASANTVKSRLRLGTRALRKRVRRERSIGTANAGAARAERAHGRSARGDR